MAFPHLCACCSICVWQRHSLFLFFLRKNDHQMKDKVPSGRVSVRIKGDSWFSQVGVGSREKEDNPWKKHCFDFCTYPSAGSHAVQQQQEGWDQEGGRLPALWRMMSGSVSALRSSSSDTKSRTGYQLFRGLIVYLEAQGSMWPVSDQYVVNKTPSLTSNHGSQYLWLSCSHAHLSSMHSGYGGISDKEAYYTRHIFFPHDFISSNGERGAKEESGK